MKTSDLGLDPKVIRGEIHREDVETRNILSKQYITPMSGATPSVANREIFEGTNAGAVNVTDFVDGAPGQVIKILGDGQMTITNGGLIFTNTGANKLLAANKVYTFTFYVILGPPKTHKWVENE